jgi:hypothetical protein
MGVFVYQSLTSFGQNPCYGKHTSNTTRMNRVWEMLQTVLDAALRKEARRVHEMLDQRQRAKDHERQRDKETEEDRFFLQLVSEQHLQAIQAFSADVSDAIAVTRMAHARAEYQQELAHEGLNTARETALVLSDGRRVYFAADGENLFGEDRNEINDYGLMQQAQAAQAMTPEATRYEDYIAWSDRVNAATAEVQALGETLDRLDTIQARLGGGDLSGAELERLRDEQQTIVDQLPPDARGEYERLQDARRATAAPTCHALSAEAEAALSLSIGFADAHDASARSGKEPSANRSPVYKSAPDF